MAQHTGTNHFDAYLLHKGIIIVNAPRSQNGRDSISLLSEGVSKIGKPASKGLYLEDLFIIPEKRGLGYGKAILKYLANIAVERNCGRMEWICLDWNAPSLAFYRKIGAFPLDEWTVQRMTEDVMCGFAK